MGVVEVTEKGDVDDLTNKNDLELGDSDADVPEDRLVSLDF